MTPFRRQSIGRPRAGQVLAARPAPYAMIAFFAVGDTYAAARWGGGDGSSWTFVGGLTRLLVLVTRSCCFIVSYPRGVFDLVLGGPMMLRVAAYAVLLTDVTQFAPRPCRPRRL